VRVKKDSIKASKSGDFPLVRPGEQSVKKRQLHKRKVMDGQVEDFCKVSIEVIIVFLIGSTDEVEVTSDDPGASNNTCNLSEFVKEFRSLLVIRGSIDICKSESEIRECGGEGGGD